MRKRLLHFLLLSCGLFGCYRPEYTGPYSCDPKRENADCPDGFRCQDRLCVTADTAMPDLSVADGCAAGGSLLAMAHGERAWACSGSFTAGAYASLCSLAPGMHVCGQEQSDDALLSLLDCDQLSGFYLVQANVTLMQSGGSYDVRCDAGPGSNGNGVLGCGTGVGAIHFSPDCHSLHHALHCPTSGAWSCSPQMGLRDVAHDSASDSSGGTLCCSSAQR